MDSNRLYESKLADDETFKAFREGLAENPSGKLRNLIELKDDVVFFWSPVECCFLCLNLNQFDEFEVLDTPYQKLHLHSPPAFQVERIKGSNCGSRMCVWGSKGVTVMELPARWGRSGLFESGNYSILCKEFPVEWIKQQDVRWLKNNLPSQAPASYTLGVMWDTKWGLVWEQPPFTVERIKGSNCGSRMCVWGSKGVTVMELPARWGRSGLFESGNYSILCKSATLDERFLYSQTEVRSVQWHPTSLSRLLVLVSDNTLRLYNVAVKTGPKLVKVITIGPKPHGLLAGRTFLDSLGDTAVDITPTPDSEHILILRGNGDVYMMPCDIEAMSSNQPKITGPLAMYPPADDNYGTDSCSIIALGSPDAPPVVVVATCSAALYHCLLLPHPTERDEGDSHALYVIEAVELNMVLTGDAELQYSYPVHLYPCTNNVYACIHAAGVHTISLPIMDSLKDYAQANEEESETVLSALCSKPSSARHLVCTVGPRGAVSPPCGLTLNTSPLPLLNVLCSDGQMFVRWLEPYIVEEHLYQHLQTKTPSLGRDEFNAMLHERQKMTFTAIIQEILAKNVSQPVLNMDKSEEPSLKETLEFLTQVTMKLRGEYIAKQQRAYDVIVKKMKALANLSAQHQSWTEDLKKDIDDVNLKSTVLKEKCMLAEKRQEDLKIRLSAAVRKLRHSGAPSAAERELLTELERHRHLGARLQEHVAQLRAHSARKAAELQKWRDEYKKKDIALGKSHSDAISSILRQQTTQISTLIEEAKLIKDQLSIV